MTEGELCEVSDVDSDVGSSNSLNQMCGLACNSHNGTQSEVQGRRVSRYKIVGHVNMALKH